MLNDFPAAPPPAAPATPVTTKSSLREYRKPKAKNSLIGASSSTGQATPGSCLLTQGGGPPMVVQPSTPSTQQQPPDKISVMAVVGPQKPKPTYHEPPSISMYPGIEQPWVHLLAILYLAGFFWDVFPQLSPTQVGKTLSFSKKIPEFFQKLLEFFWKFLEFIQKNGIFFPKFPKFSQF